MTEDLGFDGRDVATSAVEVKITGSGGALTDTAFGQFLAPGYPDGTEAVTDLDVTIPRELAGSRIRN